MFKLNSIEKIICNCFMFFLKKLNFYLYSFRVLNTINFKNYNLIANFGDLWAQHKSFCRPENWVLWKLCSTSEWCLSVPLTSDLQLLSQTWLSLQLHYTCKEQLHNPRRCRIIKKLLTNARWVPIRTPKQLLHIRYITLCYTWRLWSNPYL